MKRDGKEDTVIVQVDTNNLQTDETEEMMTKYDDMLKDERQRSCCTEYFAKAVLK